MKNETTTQYLSRRLNETVGMHNRIALESGIPQTTVSRIYRGESSPTIKTVEPLLAWFKKYDIKQAKAAAKLSKKK